MSSSRCFLDCFEHVANGSPDAIAVAAGSQRFTYRELRRRANGLARHLIRLGVRPNVPVAVLVDSPLDAVVAFVGVLKAGGTCVPFDPGEPQDWLASVSTAIGVRAWVTTAELNAALHEEGEENEQSNVVVAPDHLVLALAHGGRILTVEHHAFTERLRTLGSLLDWSMDDALLVEKRFGRDAASWESLLPLLHGGKLIVLPVEELVAPDAATVVRITAGRLAALRARSPQAIATLGSMRAVLCDAPSDSRLDLALPGKASVWSVYCAPETGTVFGIVEGRVRGASTLRILDRNRQLVPMGVSGEICLGGTGLAREYVGDAWATAERFIADPFGPSRLFRTGLSGRRHGDGHLELIGSVARQVWLEGQRVELDAIEAALLEDDAIASCAVVARQTEAPTPALVAYVVPATPWSREHTEARLAARLPQRLRPDAFVPVTRLPLTTAGQLDEQALAELELLDDVVIAAWEQQLRSRPDVTNAVVVARERRMQSSALHLDDLVPARALAAPGTRPDVGSESSTSSALSKPDVRGVLGPRSIAFGPPIHKTVEARTVPDLLERAAAGDEWIAYVGADGEESTQSYRALLDDADRIAGSLRVLGVSPGGPVILQLELTPDFVAALWGSFMAGVVPVPLPVAASSDPHNAGTAKLLNAWQLLGRPVVIAGDAVEATTNSTFGLAEAKVASISSLRNGPRNPSRHCSEPDDLALLLFTSGSTGMPKGVMQTHRSLITASAAIAQANEFSAGDVALDWMPFDHVGALVHTHLRSVLLGCRQVRAPMAWILEEPTRWLDLIERHRATDTWAPNFAFGLVNAKADDIGRRRWDLSTMRAVICAGEAIVTDTARRFTQLLHPHGLPRTAIRPAWGMSETCSGGAYSRHFQVDAPFADAIVEVGPPVPSLSIRIVDDQHQPVVEGTTGRLQVTGPTVTSGYIHNPEATRHSFTEDGWFNTGDLGVLRDGRLAITGREKDVIIINGQNLYPHEIESVVEGVPGVSRSFVAACAVRRTATETDRLAIFFHSSASDDAALAHVMGEIRARVSRSFGVSPHFLLPVEKETIPKTSIGKIERARLSQRFSDGAFSASIKRIDLLTRNANTLPNWFFVRTWRRQEAGPRTAREKTSCWLIVLDRLGLGEAMVRTLREHGERCVLVVEGPAFRRREPDLYELVLDEESHYAKLLETLRTEGTIVQRIVYLATYDESVGDIENVDVLREAQVRCVHGVIAVVRALAGDGTERVRSLHVVSSRAAPVLPDEPIAYEKSTIAGLLKSIGVEFPFLTPVLVDLEPGSHTRNSSLLLRESLCARVEPEVAYRGGRRYVPSLSKIDMPARPLTPTPFANGGVYVITGGLGRIARPLARLLVERFGARLVLVGRTVLPERQKWREEIGCASAVSLRIQRLLDIESTGGEVTYEAADVSDLSQMERVVARAETRWNARLAGIFHLAGAGMSSEVYWTEMVNHTVMKQTRAGFSRILEPKVYGTWTLYRLLEDRPDVPLITFSSLSSVIGATGMSADAAASSFLEGITQHRRRQSHPRTSPRTLCVSWPPWEDVGTAMLLKDATRAAGMVPISEEQAMHCLLAVLHRDLGAVLVGLDGDNPRIRSASVETDVQALELCAYVERRKDAPPSNPEDHVVYDRIGRKTRCRWVAVDEIPLGEDGAPDRARLAAVGGTERDASRPRTAPRSELEKRVAQIWKEVLKTSDIAIEDNFFEVGGDSLLVTRLAAAVGKAFGVSLPIRAIFAAPTIEMLARRLDETNGAEPGDREELAAGDDDASAREPRPLSLEQEVFHEYHVRGLDSAMFMPLVLSMRGPLDAGALEGAILHLVGKYEILRTVFPMEAGRARQVAVQPEERTFVTQGSVEGLSDAERSARIRQLLAEIRSEVSEVERGPCFRAAIVRVSAGEHRVILGWHHIIWDVMSSVVFLEELGSAYEAIRRGAPPDRTSPRQYYEYVRRQRDPVEGARIEKALSYHRQRLQHLPADASESAAAGVAQVQELELDTEHTQALADLSMASHVPLALTLLAAFDVLLARGGSDRVIGVVYAQRDADEDRRVLGPVLNILPIPLQALGRVTFREVTRAVRDTMTEAMQHPVPQAYLNRVIPGRKLDRIMFDFAPEATSNREVIPGMEVNRVRVEHFDGRWYDVDLLLFAYRFGGRLGIRLTTYLGKEESARLLAQFHEILRDAVRAPDALVSSFRSFRE